MFIDKKQRDSYYAQLQFINGIKFTPREIDIISCIISGRTSYKEISSILPISIKTVETNKNNIKNKLRNATSDNIRHFVEISDGYTLIKNHYNYLSNDFIFKKLLTTQKRKSNSPVIFYISKKEKKYFLDSELENYFRAAGIELTINYFDTIGKNILLSDLQHYSKAFIFGIAALNEINILDNDNIILILNKKLPHMFDTEKLEKGKDNVVALYADFYLGIRKIFEILGFNINTPGTLESFTLSNRIQNTIVDDNKTSLFMPVAKKSKRRYLIFLIIYILLFYLFSILSKNGMGFIARDPILWNLPYIPENLIKREKLSNTITTQLRATKKGHDKKIIGLYGVGGAGKTYLALDTVYKLKRDYTFAAWFSSDNITKLKADFLQLGLDLEIIDENMEESCKIRLIKDWMQKQKVILVFDNALNMDLIKNFIPPKADVIVTSRNYNIPNPIRVDVMTEEEAISLLQSMQHDIGDSEDIKKLIGASGRIPLALAQASAYMYSNKVTASDYLELLSKEYITIMSSTDMPPSHRHDNVNATLEVIFNKISKEAKAVELLNISAFCSSVNIPKIFLQQYLYGNLSTSSRTEFNKVATTLRRYSLIDIHQKTISLHNLTQDWLRAKLSKEEKQLLLQKALFTIETIYPKTQNM